MSRLGQINRVKHFFGKRASIIIINALVNYFIALLFGAILLKLIWTSSKQYRISLVAFCGALKNSIKYYLNSFVAKRLVLATNQATTLFSF